MSVPTHHQGKVYAGTVLDDLAAGDVVISAGFGTTATKTIAADSDDLRGRIDVASTGTGQAANPTVVITFKEAFEKAPIVVVSRGDTAAASGYWAVTARSTTSVTITFVGTPVAAQTYTLDYAVVPVPA